VEDGAGFRESYNNSGADDPGIVAARKGEREWKKENRFEVLVWRNVGE